MFRSNCNKLNDRLLRSWKTVLYYIKKGINRFDYLSCITLKNLYTYEIYIKKYLSVHEKCEETKTKKLIYSSTKEKSGIIFNKEFTFPSIITDVTFVLFTRKIDWATFTNKQRSFHCILSSNSHPPPPKKLLLVVKNCKRRKSQLVLSNFGKFDPLWINVYK